MDADAALPLPMVVGRRSWVADFTAHGKNARIDGGCGPPSRGCGNLPVVPLQQPHTSTRRCWSAAARGLRFSEAQTQRASRTTALLAPAQPGSSMLVIAAAGLEKSPHASERGRTAPPPERAFLWGAPTILQPLRMQAALNLASPGNSQSCRAKQQCSRSQSRRLPASERAPAVDHLAYHRDEP